MMMMMIMIDECTQRGCELYAMWRIERVTSFGECVATVSHSFMPFVILSYLKSLCYQYASNDVLSVFIWVVSRHFCSTVQVLLQGTLMTGAAAPNASERETREPVVFASTTGLICRAHALRKARGLSPKKMGKNCRICYVVVSWVIILHWAAAQKPRPYQSKCQQYAGHLRAHIRHIKQIWVPGSQKHFFMVLQAS